MKIRNHRLCDDDGTEVRFVRSPNQSGALEPKYLVMHYTAGANAESSINTLVDKKTKASAHLVIGRNGEITQLVSFNRIAWHAGKSRWHGIRSLNSHSIGIELDNAGKLDRHGNSWKSWFGRTYEEDAVTIAVHQHDDMERGWHSYTEAQLKAAVEAAKAIADRYALIDVIGHDDIAPGRKLDPGPAFPMESFRAAVIGRNDDAPMLFETVAKLNVRGGPGVDFEKLAGSPLPLGTKLEMMAREASWCFVEVPDADGVPDITGWVHGDYIKPVRE